MKSLPGARRNSAFTLTELLIVACIVMVFLFVAVIAIQGTEEATKTVGCMTNLRQLYLGMKMFADEHGGYWIGSGKEGVTMRSTMIWSGQKKCWLGILYHNYISELDTFYCPAQKDRNRPPYVNRENFGKKDEKCCSDYETTFYSGQTLDFKRLMYKDLIRCGEQDFIPNPHAEMEIILKGNGSVVPVVMEDEL